MTTTNANGRTILECDSCSETFGEEDTFADFLSMIDAAKRAGWKIERVGLEWVHKCKSCRLRPRMPRR